MWFNRFYDTPKELQYFFVRSIKVIILDTSLGSTGDNKLDYTINNMLINFLSYVADKEGEKIQGRVTNTRIDKIVIAIMNIKADFDFPIFHHPDIICIFLLLG